MIQKQKNNEKQVWRYKLLFNVVTVVLVIKNTIKMIE